MFLVHSKIVTTACAHGYNQVVTISESYRNTYASAAAWFILKAMYAAVDIGGTKTLVAVFDKKGKLIEKIKFPTPVYYDEFIQELSNNVANLSTKEFAYGCVGMPGRLDRKHGLGLISPNLPWQRVPVQADAEKIFMCPFLIENDANLAGLSEALLLKKDFQKVLYVTVSTGIGSRRGVASLGCQRSCACCRARLPQSLPQRPVCGSGA